MSQQGGPGNERKAPEQQVIISQSANADRIMAVCFLIATQRLLRLGVWPALMKPDSPAPADKLKFLLQEIHREIKNMPAQGASEIDEAAAKKTALALIDQIAGAVRKEIDS